MLRLLTLFALILFPVLGFTQTIVQVVGLFPNAAVVVVDGERRLVKVGEVGPAGVQVIRADSKGARLKVDGMERDYELGRDYSSAASVNSVKRLVIAKGLGGHYWLAGSVNGNNVQFMLDTGATSVAMNENEAKRIGLNYQSGSPVTASTANGQARGWQVRLAEVKVGEIKVLGVDAVVLEGDSPTEVLLGMSFLSHIRWRVEQDALILESKM
ncbi:TIGR02281 family clan AA aspartic protease [Pseudomonas sp. F1_0610]|uniref:retropepsin-like aspartic protease family protein n=1 Tax=Pseudomonas sp. F1_0610 TaxID=3114284 RepID=UPI0039C4E178